MKIRYDVSDGFGGGMRFEDQREAFDLAKKCAAQKGMCFFMERLVWDQDGRISVSTVAVNPDWGWYKVN